ncbi:hypothetical protein BB381_04640 [Campylobacter pinnipediorum subsp. caledonicus]|uniref:M23 family metallopeptidase n=1 Tax=Campylobacter pinnipediorum TaxID=1965231 RepID=UPI0009949634|nr:peptidoglycan DD-metalloendopeptidase family protein [Campylobacter pinnipediorum]OPA72680.1 hypothetical protein BB381_04640 [Campylobacter pinnipediorum subsp. caledonicus]
MLKPIIALVLLIINLYAIKPSVEELSWPSGTPFLSFLEKNKIPLSVFYNLSSEDKELAAEIFAGLKYQISRDNNGDVLQILIPVNDELQIHIYKDENDIFKLDFIPISYEVQQKVLNINLERSVTEDIYNYTGSVALAVGFRDAFKNEGIDFRKVRKGDRIVILYTQKIRLGKIFGTPDIHAAMIETRGRKNIVYGYNDKFYDKSGKDKTKVAFVRPLKNIRITSPFTLKRWHPILKRYRAHLGVDYGAPRGTPVKSSADGRVKFIGRKNGYGKTIIISHGGGYETLYAHLNGYAKDLKVNQTVSQGKLIAYVGSTGISTGPHLHFGFYINNKPVNPEKMMKVVRSISSGKSGNKFKAIVDKYSKEINKYSKENLTTQKAEKFLDVVEY